MKNQMKLSLTSSGFKLFKFCMIVASNVYKFCHQFYYRIREKAFREMKKDVGMTTARKSKETRRMEMGSIFVLYIQPTIPTYTIYVHYYTII